MSVALDDRWGGYSPPRLTNGSPPVPTGRPLPSRGDGVFVDSNVVYGTDCRLPLLLLAGADLLRVTWSPYVAAEIARVATREQALSVVGGDMRALGDELERRRHEIDRVIGDHEQYWHSPGPADLAATYATLPASVIPDPNDIPILAGALAAHASFLLTTNKSDFPHGNAYRSVVFWHPDTVLTAYFENHPEAYVFVRDEMPAALAEFGAQLRP